MGKYIKISEVSSINANSMTSNNTLDLIQYLDTGSLTKNKIECIQHLNTSLDVIPSRARRRVKDKTILYSTVRPNQEHYGYLDRPPKNLIVSTGFATIDVDEDKVVPKYVYYFLTQNHITSYLHTIAENSVSAYPSINPSDIGQLELQTLESRAKQQKIVNVLSSLDAKIELNNQINAELEAMAKTLYDYWFVQFDFPDAEGKPYKTSGGKMVYNEVLKREIPEGWETGTFGDYNKVKSGFAFKSTWWSDEGVPVLKIKDVLENYTLNQTDFSFVPQCKVPKNSESFTSKAGDVVIAMTGATIGKFAAIPYTKKPILINQRVGLYQLGEDPFKKLPFLINSMKQDFFRLKVFQVAGGAAQPNISNEQLNSFPLNYPIDDLIDKFNERLADSYKYIAINIKQNKDIEELRDWLLPMLMNGQVTVN